MAYHVDLTIILNVHKEGLLCWPSLRSISRAAAFARASGYTLEIIAVQDRSDAVTRDVMLQWDEASVRIFAVNFGDLGLARNKGVAEARGEYVVFLDADDLWGETWPARAMDAARNDRRKIIWHPEVNIYFGAVNEIFVHPESDDEAFDVLSLVAGNRWTALCLAAREILVQMPFPPSNLARSIGFEDWSLYRDLLGAGVIHKIVQGTGHLIRTKSQNSLNQANVNAAAIPTPTMLFRNMLPHGYAAGEAPTAAGSESDC